MSAARASAKAAPPIILIKKTRRAHGGHHGGAWKVAYADFVTAMLALFIVLWLLSSSVKVQKAVGGYFQNPRGDGRLAGTRKSGSGEALELRKEQMTELKERIHRAMAQEVKEFEAFKDQVQITITEEGLRVELLETEKGTFFDTGKVSPTVAGADILSTLGQELGKLPNKVLVEGHTDARPYAATSIYSNWELSSDRANAARRLMQGNGLRSDQVTQIRGFADQSLRKKSEPEDPSNRRVSIIIKYQE